MRTIYWDKSTEQVKTIDQRALPGRVEWITLKTGEEVAAAIQNMIIRGAPAIGVAGAYGMVLAAYQCKVMTSTMIVAKVLETGKIIQAARPTAVNLKWAIDRMGKVVLSNTSSTKELHNLLLAEAEKIAEEDIQTNLKIAKHGIEIIEDGDVIIHHCNTGSLATVEGGTALGVIKEAWKQGKRLKVLVDETRPLFQGSRLTAWELQQEGIPYEIITDSAAGFFLERKLATKVMFGADRVAANGDVANKIGSYMLALAAHANQIPVYSVFPYTSVDASCGMGSDIEIEFRAASELLDVKVNGNDIAPEGAKAINPAFDITPNHLITAWITDEGIIYPPFKMSDRINLGEE
jgi:methylthioribose-1-phosphate isomerase